MKKISVIAPIYNVEQYIPEFLQSIRDQKMKDIEIVLVDDGSTDNSLRIAREYSETDERVIILHKENGGVSSARNAGIEIATGEYLYIVDSDDWLEKDALENLWNEASINKSDIIYGMHYLHAGDRKTTRKSFPNAFFTTDRNTINEIQCALMNNNDIKCDCREFKTINGLGGAPWKGMVKRSVITEHGIRYNENLKKLGEDILFWQEVYEHVRSVSYIEKPIYHYRRAENSLSHGYKQDLLEIYKKVFTEEEKFLKDYKKTTEHWNAYYFRVLLYIRQSIGFYFKNKNNKSDESARYRLFVDTLESDPYRSAIKNVPLSKLISYKSRARIFLLKAGMYALYWLTIE